TGEGLCVDWRFLQRLDLYGNQEPQHCAQNHKNSARYYFSVISDFHNSIPLFKMGAPYLGDMGHRRVSLHQRNILGHRLGLSFYHINDLALSGLPGFHAHAFHKFLELGISINLRDEVGQNFLLAVIHRGADRKVVHAGEVHVDSLIPKGTDVA
ncbi:C_GCAxxG_C_C family protein, partial [Dysosmobacter welbionis]